MPPPKASKVNRERLGSVEFEERFAKVYGPARWAELRSACGAKQGKVALLNKFLASRIDLVAVLKRPVIDVAAVEAAAAAGGAPEANKPKDDGLEAALTGGSAAAASSSAAAAPAAAGSKLTAENLAKAAAAASSQELAPSAAAAAAAPAVPAAAAPEVLLQHPLLRKPGQPKKEQDQKEQGAAAAAAASEAQKDKPAVDSKTEPQRQQKDDNGDDEDNEDPSSPAGSPADGGGGKGKKVKTPLHLFTLPHSGLRYVAKPDGCGSTGFPSMPRDERTGDPVYYLLDLASLFVVDALRPDPYSKVLDMCAAPGGKSVAIGQLLSPAGELVSNEAEPRRRERLDSVLKLFLGVGGVNAPVQWKMTGRDASTWHQPNSFDRVLVDAPCGSERHLIENSDTASWSVRKCAELAKLQTTLLMRAFETANARGRIVYSTCSIDPLQNDAVVEIALQRTRCQVVVEESYVPPPGFGAAKTPCGGWMFMPDGAGRGIGPIFLCVFTKVNDTLMASLQERQLQKSDSRGGGGSSSRSGGAKKKSDGSDDDEEDEEELDESEYETNSDGSPKYDQFTGKRVRKDKNPTATRKAQIAVGKKTAAFWNA